MKWINVAYRNGHKAHLFDGEKRFKNSLCGRVAFAGSLDEMKEYTGDNKCKECLRRLAVRNKRRAKEIEEEIETLKQEIFWTEMSEDSFEPHTQASQEIHKKWDEINKLKKELDSLKETV